MTEYKLSASLTGHEDDVRDVLFPTPKVVLSASRDSTTRLWKLISDTPPRYDATITSNSGSWLNALTYLPPSQEYPEGLIVSGGKDLIIEVRQPSKTQEDSADALLLGHGNTICSLDVDPNGKFVVSGAWDHEARIWPVGKWECETMLQGHEGSVWAVIAYDPDTIVTACADQKIRVFSKLGKLLNQFQASQQPVRALVRLPKGHASGAEIASAGNDGVIRLWTLKGQQKAELHGHESFIYSLACLPTGELVSSGEDRTLRVWKGTECIQTITHPAVSVWSVAVCAENGDIVSGASDKVVRVFSRSPDKVADPEIVAQFEESVKASAIPKETIPEVNKEKLPGPDFLTKKSGTKEGQIQLIKEDNGTTTAHQWSAGQQQWISIGQVVDSVGSSRQKEVYNGKEYDFVFSVDMEDGKPALKLPYNLSENPYEAASRFITNNEAPISYLDQVANFIIQNTQGHTVGQQQASSAPDPWGTESRYRPGDGDVATSAPAAPPAPKILPQQDYLSITVARVAAIQKKVLELNSALIAAGSKDLSLNPAEISILASLCAKLESSSATTAPIPELELAIKLTTVWPYKDRLPGLDLIRLLAVAPITAKFTHSRSGSIVEVLEHGAAEQSPPAENHTMMAIRAFANLFESTEGRSLALKDFKKIQSFITTGLASTSNRNLLVAATTVYINYAVLFTSAPADASFEHAIAILDTLGKIISTQNDSEAVYRALVALGTLLGLDEEVRSAGKDVYGLKQVVDKAVGKASDPRIKNVGREVSVLLQ